MILFALFECRPKSCVCNFVVATATYKTLNLVVWIDNQ